MKLLITGAGGQLGKEWVQFCIDRKVPFEAFDSKGLDITNPALLKEIIVTSDPDVIINCAAYTKVDQAEDEEELATRINGEAVKSLSEVCAEKDIKLVHYSTDYVFSGSAEDREQFPAGYPEDHTADPINVYGKTKWMGEEYIRQSGCDHLILRVSWLCGKHGHNFIKTMLRLAEDRDELTVVNDQFGCPTFADQVVEQTWQLLQQEENGVFHISSEGVITWFDFAKAIFEIKGIDISVKPVSSAEFKTKAKRPLFSKLNTQKIENVPGIEIKDWKENLSDLLSESE
jgi:dTDP-4-dehydrorhamnose reductase